MARLVKSRVERARLGFLCTIISFSFGILRSILTSSSSTRGSGFPSHALSEATFPVDGKRLLSSKPKKKINLQNLIQNQNQRLMSSKPQKNIMSKKNFIPQNHTIQAKNSILQKQSKQSVRQKNVARFVRHNHTNRPGPFRGIGTFSGKNSLKQSTFAHDHKKKKKILEILRGHNRSYDIQDEDPSDDAVRAYSRIDQLQGEQQLEPFVRIDVFPLNLGASPASQDTLKDTRDSLAIRPVGQLTITLHEAEITKRSQDEGQSKAPEAARKNKGLKANGSEICEWHPETSSSPDEVSGLSKEIKCAKVYDFQYRHSKEMKWTKVYEFDTREYFQGLGESLEDLRGPLSIDYTSSTREQVPGKEKNPAGMLHGTAPAFAQLEANSPDLREKILDEHYNSDSLNNLSIPLKVDFERLKNKESYGQLIEVLKMMEEQIGTCELDYLQDNIFWRTFPTKYLRFPPSGDNKSDENVDEMAKKEEDVQLVKACAHEASRHSIEKKSEQLCTQSSKSEMDSESEASESEASEAEVPELEGSESEGSKQESDSSQPSASSSDTPQQAITNKQNSIEPMQGLPRVSAGELEWNEVVHSTRQRGRPNHEDMSNTNCRQHSRNSTAGHSQIPKLNVSRALAATNRFSKLTKLSKQSHGQPIAEEGDSSEDKHSEENQNFQNRFDKLTLGGDSDDKVNHEHGSGENFQRNNDTNSGVELLSSENESRGVQQEEEKNQQTDRQLQALGKGVSVEYYNFDSVFLIFFVELTIRTA